MLSFVQANKTVLSMFDIVEICEIPIYGVAQKDYNDYWKNRADRYTQKCLEISPDRKDVEDLPYKYLSCEAIPWKYNQVIGFLRVSVGKQNVYVEEFHCPKNYRRSSRAGHWIFFNCHRHNYIGNLRTNKEIIAAIKNEVNESIVSIRNCHPKYHFDTTSFDNIIDFIDFITMIGRN